MFKRLKEKITEEVSKSPLRLQTVQTQIGQYSPFNGAAKKPSDSQGSSESDAPTQNDGQNLIDLQENSSSIMDVNESQQFSIADEDGASSTTASPIPQAQFQRYENVELTPNSSVMAGSFGRPRTSSVSSTGSQPSFFPVYSPMQSSYSIQSDLESTSEMEDAGVNLDIISKEQLYQAFQKAKAKYTRYKARYGDVVKAYREQVNEKEKIKTILTESQDKALRRISELREQSQLEQKAKAHLEDSFRVTLEEKDELLRVLQTQIRLLKNGEDPTEKQNDDDTQTHLVDISSDPVKDENEETTDENTQLKIKTYEETIVKLKSLLKNCKDTIVKHRENNVRLAADRDQLAEKLNELNAQLNRLMEDKSEKDRDLLNELMQASQTIENYKTKEAEDALSMAETKRLMHEEMEAKEKKLQELIAKLQQACVDKEELQRSVEVKSKELSEMELKCKDDVESAKLRLEEAEKMLEDEKQNLLQELSRGKAAAIQLMQQEADKRLKEMEDERSAALQALELEWQTKMQEKVQEEVDNLAQQDALQEIATLKNEVREKEMQLKHLVEEKTLFQEQVQEQCGRQAAMEKDVHQMALEKQALQAELRRLQNSSLAHPLLAAKDAIAEQLKELRNWVSKMKLDVSEHMSSVNSEFSRLSQAHDSELEPLVGAIESLKLENEKYAEENGRFKEDFDAAQQKIMQLESRYVDSAAAVEQLQSQLRQLEHEREEAFEELAHLKLLKDDLDVLNARCERSGVEIVSLREELASRDAEIKVLSAQKEQQRNDLLARDARIADLKFDFDNQLSLQKQGLELELKELQEAQEANEVRHTEEIAIINERMRAESERNEALLKLDSAMNSTPMESKALQCHLEEDSAGCEHGSHLLEANRLLALELDNVKNGTETLRVEVDSLREQLNANQAEYEQHIGELDSEIEAKQSELQRLESLCAEQDVRIKKLHEPAGDLAQEKQDLSARLAEKDAALVRLEEEKDDLSSKLAENVDLLQQIREEQINLSSKLVEKDAALLLLENVKGDLSSKLAENVDLLQQAEKEKADLSSELAEKDAALLQLEDEKDDLSSKLAENVDLLQRTRETQMDLGSKLAEKDAALLLLEGVKGDLSSKLAKNVDLLQRVEEENTDLRARQAEIAALVLQLEEEKANLSASVNEKVSIALKLEKELSENVALLQQSEEEKSSLSANLAESIARLLRIEEEKNAASANLEEMLTLEQRLKDQDKLQSDFERCQGELLVKNRLSEELTAKVASLESTLADVSQRASNVGELVATHESRIHALTEERETLEKTVFELMEINASQVNSVGELEGKLKRTEGELGQQLVISNAENEKLRRALEESVEKCQSVGEKLREALESRDSALENLKTEGRELKAALDEALEQKRSVENELMEAISQKEAEIAELQTRVQEMASELVGLQGQKADLEREMLEERKEHEMLMRQKLQQVNEENQNKLADLRKRAENKLAQIKKQLVYDADKAKEELQSKIANLEEQKRTDDEAYSEKLAKERNNVAVEFQDKIAGFEKSLEELQTALENEKASCSEEKEALIAELALKNSQIDESLLHAQENHQEMSQRIDNLQTQLEQAEASLKTSENELAEVRRRLAEKEELALLLEAQLPAEGGSSEYEWILKCKEEEHAIKIKQLVKEFSEMIAQKEEDGQQALAKAIETSLNEDNRLRREHAVHLNELQNEFGEKEITYEMTLEEKEGIIQAKSAELEKCSQAYEEKMDLMKTEHQRQMQELEKKWKAMLRKELKQQAAIHEEDVNGLTQEWQLERKLAPAIDYNSVAKIEVTQEELQQQTNLASSAIESGGQSSELLRRQIMTMQTQMEMLKDRHKAEVSELHQILQASNCPVPSGKSVGKGIFRDRPALQSLEIEYLKNILFEYMMGRETLTLAKVIATVVQFSDEQLNKILEKEESRGGGVSGQLGQIWK